MGSSVDKDSQFCWTESWSSIDDDCYVKQVQAHASYTAFTERIIVHNPYLYARNAKIKGTCVRHSSDHNPVQQHAGWKTRSFTLK